MKVSILVSILASAVCANASILDQFQQYVFQSSGNQDSVFISEENVFEKFNIAGLEGAEVSEIQQAWKDMEAELGAKKVQKAIDQYNSKNGVKADQMNNREKVKTFSEDPQFEVLSHPKFKDHSLRVKKTTPEVLGLDTVDQYTGYLDVVDQGKHFFYWMFESRNDPKNDPVVLWLNGGPGCSSATGLFFELGPASINSTLQPVHNPHSWNSNATVIFLDQPVGVGYSYTEGEDVKSTAAAAKDIYVFLELFFQKFPHLTKNKFHIAGESYAGHYIPSFASEIINQADRSFELSSVLIGNGITDPLIQYAYYKPMACGEGGYKPVLDEETCEKLDKDYPKCAALTELCYKFQNVLSCVPATYYCETALFGPYADTGLNPYDIRKNCAEEGGNCYVEMDYLEDYLNLDYVKKSVGAETDIFTGCDDTVFKNFILNGDEQKPFQQYVAELLEKRVPVLLYAGDKDYICNWLGNHAWSDALEYSDHEIFGKIPLRPWYTHGGKKPAGEVKNWDIFTFLRVYDAGHMVPYDQPENSLAMLNTWIQGDYGFIKY